MNYQQNKDIQNLLHKIGLVREGQPLAFVHNCDYPQHYDLTMLIDLHTAKSLVETTLGLKTICEQEYGCQYWHCNVDNQWEVFFEDYQNRGQCLTISDLRERG